MKKAMYTILPAFAFAGIFLAGAWYGQHVPVTLATASQMEVPITRPETIAVPVDAVLDAGTTQTVFVERGEGVFEPWPVETGACFGDTVEILKGLAPGERIVTSGTFLLDSESRMKLAAGGDLRDIRHRRDCSYRA